MVIKNSFTFLHLVDDEKFTDFIINSTIEHRVVGGVDIVHQFVILNVYASDTYKVMPRENLFTMHSVSQLIDFIDHSCPDAVLVHCLTLYKVMALSKVNNDFVLSWSLFGVDYYKSPLFKDNLFAPLTKDYQFKASKGLNTIVKDRFRNVYHYFKYGATYKSALIKVIKRTHIFAPVVPTEFDLINRLSFFKALIGDFSNGSMEQNLGQLINFNAGNLENNILVGNSNTPESNHLDVFELLSKRDTGKTKIITILSYGGTNEYKNTVVKKGKELFSNLFEPILDFMPLSEYNHKVKSCNTAIYFHYRQQAVGNIVASLYLGQRVYLSKNSTVFQYFKSRHIHVFSVEDDLLNEQEFKRLDDDLVMQNRQILMEMYGKDAVAKKHRKFYEQLIDQIQDK